MYHLKAWFKSYTLVLLSSFKVFYIIRYIVLTALTAACDTVRLCHQFSGIVAFSQRHFLAYTYGQVGTTRSIYPLLSPGATWPLTPLGSQAIPRRPVSQDSLASVPVTAFLPTPPHYRMGVYYERSGEPCVTASRAHTTQVRAGGSQRRI